MASRATRLHLNVHQAIRCDSQKVGFCSRAEALEAAENLMQQGRVMPGCHITPYECNRCGQWHVANRRIVVNLPPFPPNRKVKGHY